MCKQKSKFEISYINKYGIIKYKHFHTHRSANEFLKHIRSNKKLILDSIKSRKNNLTKQNDLPKRFHEVYKERKLPSGNLTIISSIKVTIKKNRNLYCFERAFGRKRSRYEAIEMCKLWDIEKNKELINLQEIKKFLPFYGKQKKICRTKSNDIKAFLNSAVTFSL